MQFEGILSTWNDERGFGLIQPLQGGEPIFVHITSFARLKGRPALQQRLVFEVLVNAQGKKRAIHVQLPTPRPSARPVTRQRTKPAEPGLASRWAIALFVLLALGVAAVWQVSWWMPAVYGAMSVVCFTAYAVDKSRAETGRWRTPERTLLALGLACGWPGAVVAQRVLRHKSAKVSFQHAFWGTVCLNVAGFIGWFTPLGPTLASALMR